MADIRYGFEAGTTAPPGDDAGHGEMVAFNGNGFVKSTRTGSAEYYKTVYGTYIRCEAAGFVSHVARGLRRMTWTAALNDMFTNVEERCGAVGAAFGGMVHFEKLVGVAIALPTMSKENIFEAKEKYYPFAPHVEHNVRCVVVGFIADMAAAATKGVSGLDKVLYKGASGAAGGGADNSLALHTHLVTLRRSCVAQRPQDVRPQDRDVKEVYHLDSSSIVADFTLEHETLPPTSSLRSIPAPAPAKCNCSEWVVNALADAGVTHIFGGHGGALVPMVNAICKNPRVKWIYTRNEANASLMAAAYAKLTGRLAVCVATSGPGASNLTTGLLDALQDQCPMIAITGLKPRAGIGYSEFQDLQQSRMFAAGGLPMSLDVHSADALLRAAAERGAGRCVIACGHRAVGAGEEILKLAERIHAPVLTRLDAKGVVNEAHPLAFGVIGVHGKSGLEKATKVIESAQLIISIGPSVTLSSERLGTMGYGLCAGLVASLVRGSTGRAVVVAGDGGIQMTINELGTAKQVFEESSDEHSLVIILLDNSKLGRVVFGFEGAEGCDLVSNIDFVMLAKAYGGDGLQVSSCEQLEGAMDAAFKSKGIFMLHVLTDPELKADMATFQDKSITMMNSG
eukprot:g25.t2